MKVSVVVTVLNEGKSIERLLRALISQSKKPDEIIVVDGGSKDSTIRKTENAYPRASFAEVATEAEQGFGGQAKRKTKIPVEIYTKLGNRSMGRNYGIEKARNEVIAVTDAGGYPKKDWLEKITKPFNNKAIDVVSGYYKPLARTPFERCATPYFLIMPDKVRRGTEFLPSSRSVAFRKGIWEKAGGYPEEFSHNEDLAFDHRLKEAGTRIFFEPKAIVWWQPPHSLTEAARKFFSYALGDAEAKINRPKVKFIFARYILGIVLLLFRYYNVLLFCVLLYFLWSWQKNFKYAKTVESIFWLPAIQICADVSVMAGHAVGLYRRMIRND